MALVNNFYDFSAENPIKDIRILNTEMSKLLNTSKNVIKEINKIANLKININLNTKGIEKNIDGVSDSIKTLSNDIVNTMSKVKINLNTKDIEKNIDDISDSIKALSNDIVGTMSKANGEISKADNNANLRGPVQGDFSYLYNGMASYVGQFSDAILPSGAGSILTGASKGFAAGMLTGNPVITVASTIIGAGAEFALSSVQKDVDKRKQRISFASGIVKSYLPKIAMSSLNYAADMEKSRINYENLLGTDRGNAFVDKMLEVSGKGFYQYSDLGNTARQLLSAGFGEDQTLEIFNAVGNASAAKGGGKEDAFQMLEALKSMKTTGELTVDNMDVFEKIGVDAYGILADSIEITGKKTKATKDDLKGLISQGVIPADSAINKLISGLESKYAGMMDKQGQGFSSLVSRIKDSANQIVLGPLGEGFIKGIKPALAGFASFFGFGTEGFKNLKDEISDFGYKIGELAGGAINTLRNTFNEFFNNEDFKNASLPDKFMMIFREINKKANEWYKGEGMKLKDSIKKYFTEFFTEIAKDNLFQSAIQDLWLAISPDDDTIRAMVSKALGLGFFNYDIQSFQNEENQQRADKNKNKKEDLPERRNSKAIGLNRVPYDYYPALLHEGEAVLRRTEADNYRNSVGKGVIISKIADTIVVKDETDMYKLADILVSEIEKAGIVYGGAM